jgi:sulfonate transport system permease protein
MSATWPVAAADTAAAAPMARRAVDAASPWQAWGTCLLALIVPALVGALWWLAAEREWIAPQVLPHPVEVWRALQEAVFSGALWGNLRISAWRALGGFAVGATLGLLLGVVMGLSPTAKDYLYPSFKAFAQVPVIGWLPLLMLLVGIDEALKIILVAKAAAVPVAINTLKGIEGVPSRWVEVARVFGYTRPQLLRHVVFPAALGPIWTGLRFGLTHAWLALVVVELLASSEGLGFMIVYGRQLFQLDVVLAGVVVVGIVGYALDRALAAIEARLGRWRREAF